MPESMTCKVYSLHAPEVECMGKGKAHRPREFGVKVSALDLPSRVLVAPDCDGSRQCAGDCS